MQTERHNPYKERRQMFALIIVLMIVVATLLFLRFVLGGNEDSWECENGIWIQHGKPSDPMPSYPCE